MVPGILVLLVTMLTLFLSAMNIVREKEIGTLEQINVTPIKKHQFIIGKLFVLGIGSNAVKCWTANCQTGV
jgi:ABC-2 type transport system permease protein